MTHKKVGGLHFARFGRVQISFCICKQQVKEPKKMHDLTLGLTYVALSLVLVLSLVGV